MVTGVRTVITAIQDESVCMYSYKKWRNEGGW